MNKIQSDRHEKAELLSFIKWKLRHDKETYNKWIDELKKMGLMELTRWAIRFDIIDA